MFKKPPFQCPRRKCCDRMAISKDLSISAFYEPSMIEAFLHYRHKAPGSSVESCRVTSDIYMLFNQQRLDRMTREALISHFNSLSVRDPDFSSLKSKLSDDQLISIVKSRYIQAPSELLAYSRSLNCLADEQLKAYVESLPKPSSSSSGNLGSGDSGSGNSDSGISGSAS